jgi:hypothetical protein
MERPQTEDSPRNCPQGFGRGGTHAGKFVGQKKCGVADLKPGVHRLVLGRVMNPRTSAPNAFL